MPIDNNVFCKGLFCVRKFRKKCIRCGVYVCKQCSKPQGKKTLCPDCSIDIWFEKMFKDVENQIKEIEKNIEEGK